jgi:hypothetical protein
MSAAASLAPAAALLVRSDDDHEDGRLVTTDFHAKYFAYELTKRCTSDSVEKLTAVLADAQVDLNPH